MVINKPFKNYVRELFEKQLDENLEAYVEETLSVAKRRHSFLKCGLSNDFDGTEDDQIKIRGIEDYKMPSAERKFTLLEDEKGSGSESEFLDVDTDYCNDFAESDSELESD